MEEAREVQVVRTKKNLLNQPLRLVTYSLIGIYILSSLVYILDGVLLNKKSSINNQDDKKIQLSEKKFICPLINEEGTVVSNNSSYMKSEIFLLDKDIWEGKIAFANDRMLYLKDDGPIYDYNKLDDKSGALYQINSYSAHAYLLDTPSNSGFNPFPAKLGIEPTLFPDDTYLTVFNKQIFMITDVCAGGGYMNNQCNINLISTDLKGTTIKYDLPRSLFSSLSSKKMDFSEKYGYVYKYKLIGLSHDTKYVLVYFEEIGEDGNDTHINFEFAYNPTSDEWIAPKSPSVLRNSAMLETYKQNKCAAYRGSRGDYILKEEQIPGANFFHTLGPINSSNNLYIYPHNRYRN